LSYLHNNFARTQGRTTASTLRAALAPHLRDTDAARFDFALHLAERARLIKIVGQRLRPDPKPSTDWLRAPGRDQLRQLFETWRSDTSWPDLQHVAALQIDRAVSIKSDPVAIRAVSLAALHEAVPGAWHTLAALSDRLKTQSPDFVRADFDTDYVREAASGEYLRGFAAWDRLEGALIRDLVTRPLHWLGLIDLDDHASVFRLTATGAALLGLDSSERSIEAAPLFIARADATISVSAVRRYDRFQLARVADPLALSGDEYLYRITPSSLERAASQKIDAPKVIDFLARAATQPVPLALNKAIQRWLKRGREVKVERAVIVRVKEAAILKRLQESPKTRGISIEVLGPTAARINEKDWPRLVKILAEAGVLVD
ncbi:MAG TPA: helicase-associated domain-containing protein, partial [Anaerolineae bacterium]|nr:helicase-associated domain-containing protein [Anaerolineae bacterium]